MQTCCNNLSSRVFPERDIRGYPAFHMTCLTYVRSAAGKINFAWFALFSTARPLRGLEKCAKSVALIINHKHSAVDAIHRISVYSAGIKINVTKSGTIWAPRKCGLYTAYIYIYFFLTSLSRNNVSLRKIYSYRMSWSEVKLFIVFPGANVTKMLLKLLCLDRHV
jgi:hypothetical protein